MRKNLIVLLLIISIVKVVNCQNATIVNPIMMGFYPDPSILKQGDDYYLINSTFSYFPGIPIHHSKDLIHWKQIGNVIDRPSQMDFMGERMTRGLFAPAINYYKGIYYVTCTDIDHDGNFVVTATKPEGPWSNPVKIPEVRGIDPSLFFDEEHDKAYIMYNSGAPENKPLYSGHRTIRIYEFDYKNLKVVGSEKQLVNGGVHIEDKPVWIEGPHILKRADWYYLYAAEGGTSVNHSEVVFRSKSATGPYIAFGNNPILTQRDLPEDRKHPITSAGHAQFVEGPDGKTYVVYLAVRPYEGDFYNTGRETFLAPVEWKNDWPIIEPGTKELLYQYPTSFKAVKQKGALPNAGNFSYKTKFDKDLDQSFLFMRTIDPTSFSISKKMGLTLNLKPETISEFGNPSFIGKRQQHINSSVETEMKFAPQKENDQAGLTIFQSEDNFYFLNVSMDNGQTIVQLTKSGKKGKTEVLAVAPIVLKNDKIYLKIASKGAEYEFYFAVKKNNWQTLKDKVDGKFLSTKVAGGFLGSLYGLYTTSLGQPSTNKASFKYLIYEGKDDVYK